MQAEGAEGGTGNKGVVFGNTINVFSGSQLSLDLTNELRFETRARGTVAKGELKIGSDRNNLPYRMSVNGKPGASVAFVGNPVTVQ